MTSQSKNIFGAASVLAIISCAQMAKAVPYASGISNNAGTVSFILNEAADSVRVIFDGGASTNDPGSAKGLHSFALGGATTYEIQVVKNAPQTWAQISVDTNNFVKFFQPKGIAVNLNPANLALFGRIYVGTSTAGTTAPVASGRTTGKGIYVLNADQSDALGQGDTELTGGIFFASSANSPFRIEIGQDNNLYIGDFADANANIYQTDADVSSGSGATMLSGIGNTANPTVHTTCNGSPIAKGSLATSDLVLWAIDGQWGNGFGRILRWDIGAGPIPYNSAPTELGFVGSTTNEVQSDLDMGPDGKFYSCQARVSSDIGAVRVFDSSGATVLWNSKSNSASGVDPFVASLITGPRSVKVSPDGKTLAIIRNDTQVWLVGLTNGIPDLTRTNLLALMGTASGTSSNAREVSWDIAGNLYLGDSSHERLRVWSPGGLSTAITKSDGTFQLITPPSVISVTASNATVSEGGASNGVFILTRSGVITNALTVYYTMGGTATNGTDYTTLSGSITFATNATTTNITLGLSDDLISEFTESATLNLVSSNDYGLTTPASATVSILDNDTPELAMSIVQSNLLESFSGARATYQITRKGLLTPALTANVSYLSGTATVGADFNGPATVTIPANAVSTNFTISPINDNNYEGTETAIASVASGSGYNVGTPTSATAFIIEDDLPATSILFSDKFDFTTTATNWVVNNEDGGADSHAEFGYNYGADGIPEAPSSTGTFTGTRGLKFRINESFGTLSGISASPAGKSFTGDYRLRFDMWLNYIGPLGVGGLGSTQHGSAGIGTSGTRAIWPFGASDGVWFTASSDGGVIDTNVSTADYAVYLADAIQTPDSGFYAAGTGTTARGSGNVYYNLWGGVAAPASQLSAHSSQTGVTPIGSLGMSWHSMTITKAGTNVTWDVDGRRLAMASFDPSTLILGDNVFVGHHDWFTSVVTNPAVQFGLVDNVRVENLIISLGPTITGIVVTNGNVQIDFTGTVADLPASFALQSTSILGVNFSDVSATITSQGSGTFRAIRALGGTQQFYQIRRQ